MLETEKTYHIFNRANGNDRLFYTENNYPYFLKKFSEYILPVADIFCYCLMPNHFHFLLRIKSEREIAGNFSNLQGLITQQFSNFFNAYSKAINKQQNRRGSLFMKNFKQKQVEGNDHLRKIVHYIHYNPVEAGLCATPGEYTYSSYNAITSNAITLLKRAEVIDWFDDIDNFSFVHLHPPSETGIE